jgi:hypothetical protein
VLSLIYEKLLAIQFKLGFIVVYNVIVGKMTKRKMLRFQFKGIKNKMYDYKWKFKS